MEEGNCQLSRWQLIKNSLNNLAFDEFTEKQKAISNSRCFDVRTRQEFDNWHLDRAEHLDYFAEDLIDELEKLDPKSHYFIYCRTSRRSIRVCWLMKNMDFDHVYNLKDGTKEIMNSSK